MSLTVSVLQGGTNSHETSSEEVNAIATDFVSDGVVGAITNTSGVAPATGGFAVNAQSTPDMTVAVSAGTAYVTGTPTSGNSQTVRVKNSASANVTIAANSTGGTRYDWVYIELNPDAMKDPASDASDVASLTTSRSTSASTDNGTPPTYGYPIAVVTVANGASSITNGNITDSRDTTGASGTVAIKNANLDTTAGELGGAWTTWTPTWTNITVGSGTVDARYTKVGKTITARLDFTYGSGSAVSGDVEFTLPVSAHSSYNTSNVNIGTVQILDTGTAIYGGYVRINTSTTNGGLRAWNASSTYLSSINLSSTIPMTWASGDKLSMQFVYEAAA